MAVSDLPGAQNLLPFLDKKQLPVQYARTPSNFSDIHQPAMSNVSFAKLRVSLVVFLEDL
jgi:hypothetical protein